MSEEVKEEDLLPCPFCGLENIDSTEYGEVFCSDCGVLNTPKSWNTRAPSPREKNMEGLLIRAIPFVKMMADHPTCAESQWLADLEELRK